MTGNTCSRCGDNLRDPVQETANYVVHEDFEEEEETEVHYAKKNTPETTHAVARMVEETGRDFDALAAEMAHPAADETRTITVGTERQENDDGTFVETAKKKEVDFSIPLDKFNEEEVGTPERIKDDDVALVETTTEPRPVQKTGLVCRNCTKPNEDEILWGPDT